MLLDRTTEWYRSRSYVHFDVPLSLQQATALVSSPENVARHSFWPQLGFRRRERRWSTAENKFKVKSRAIAYASHADSHIFAYYAFKLGELYEDRVRAYGLENVVLAYRKHDRGDGRGKANYHFAADAVAEILRRGDCDVVCIDVSKFFDTIPHKPLKNQWKRLLGVAELPKDHYAVFKAATRHAVVPLHGVRKKCGVGRRRFKRISRLPVSGRQFREIIRAEGLVTRNAKPYGIPQGLPISGLLANLVMLDADVVLNNAAQATGASYRRYSDDILLICPPERSAEVEELVESKLAELDLQIQPEKTVRVQFRKAADGQISANKPLQYLGLTFDGRRVLVRPQTVVRFLKRMMRAANRAKNSAGKHGPAANGRFRIRRRDLYARYSHLGPHPETQTRKRPAGSFFGYLRRVGEPFDQARTRQGIIAEVERQLRRSWARLNRQIRDAERKLNEPET